MIKGIGVKKSRVLLLAFLLCMQPAVSTCDDRSSFGGIIGDAVTGGLALALGVILSNYLINFLNQSPTVNLAKQTQDNFASVAGQEEAKEELREIVDFLKNPEKYQKLGAELPRGVLLTGDPGNGKTLLARAIAGEAGVPFFSVNGSEFVEVYVGVGPARLRELYRVALLNAPAIIFIDEIDAVGRQRSGTSDNSEYDNTLNQLLVMMDGFEKCTKTVVFIGATNFKEALDPALLRPGRFDRIVQLPLPDIKNRMKIIEHFVRAIAATEELNLHEIAQSTVGFSGAHLKNLVNEAAIIASKKNHTKVSQEDLVEARDKVMYGKALKSRVLNEKEKKICAIHESGHALVNLLIPQYSLPLYKITVIPHGDALGFTGMMFDEDHNLSSKEELIARIMMLLGGRAAEEIMIGKISTGASNDFKRASQIARQMVMYYGMSQEMGTVFYEPGQDYSQETLQRIDQQVKRIINKCYEETRLLLAKHITQLQAISSKVYEEETLYIDDIKELISINAESLEEGVVLPTI